MELNEDQADKAEVLIDELERADDPKETFENFTEEEQDIVTDYLSLTDVKVEPSTPIMPANSGCLDVTATLQGENTLGSTLWTYEAEVSFCYDGNTVSDISTNRIVSSESVGWTFDGHLDDTEEGGEGESYYQYWSQGEFSLCLGGDLGCVQSSYPWVEVEVYSDGEWDTDGVELDYPIPIPY